MFTQEQISSSHSKVKSGAGFPAYINELKQLGVTHYETFVADGHTDFSVPVIVRHRHFTTNQKLP